MSPRFDGGGAKGRCAQTLGDYFGAVPRGRGGRCATTPPESRPNCRFSYHDLRFVGLADYLESPPYVHVISVH